MDVPSLLEGIDMGDALRHEIAHLISSKAGSVESDMMPRNIILDDFIDNALLRDRNPPPKDELERLHVDRANALFKKIVMM